MSESTIKEITRLFEQYGHKTYGEGCSQLTHAVSCAMAAKNMQRGEPLIVAALLHDVGHFIADNQQLPGMTSTGHPLHDLLGSRWLKSIGFPVEVTEPVRLHVQAKRYLAAKVGNRRLSWASSKTLEQQGGAMTVNEQIAFEQELFFEQALLLRKCDESGKPENQVGITIDYWLDNVETVLRN